MKDVTRLKNHLNTMEKELDYTNKQIKLFEKNHPKSEWNSIDSFNGRSIDELKIQEKNLSQEIDQIKKDIKKTHSKTLLITEISLLPVVVLLILISGIGDSLTESTNIENTSLKTRHLIENLRGDTVDTWKSWRLVGTTLNVNIINAKGLSEDRIEKINQAIISESELEFDDSLTHKGPKGFSSNYYEGWAGALKKAQKEDTVYNLPTGFNIITSSGGEGDIIITLSNLRDTDGYSGYTKSIVDGNEILKSFITIYDVNNLDDEELGTILRHEFGHALGLGHSTAPEDLMAPNIDMTVPYISECNIDAIIELYNGIQGSTVCEK
ncbi:MAG TPA: matrixin family metalloprotease [Nitrosopumilaceae archaeon]|nr:matrixin family metalloprotease [Nitrosopumilaceae archaeon]